MLDDAKDHDGIRAVDMIEMCDSHTSFRKLPGWMLTCASDYVAYSAISKREMQGLYAVGAGSPIRHFGSGRTLPTRPSSQAAYSSEISGSRKVKPCLRNVHLS